MTSTLSTPSGSDLGYVEDFTPGSGRRTPVRSWLASDAPQLSLNGDWRFRLWASVAEAEDQGADVPALDFDDASWDTLSVPSHWVLAGDGAYGRPAYTNVQYPFPIDPPFVPDENPTGDHRRTFEMGDWDVERLLLRFDGVESVYRVWLNQTVVGVGKGSRLVQEFDVTDLVRPGTNVLVVRVHQWSSMSYVEDQDQWWLPGIFRSVTLLGRPLGAIDDVWLQARYSHEHGTGAIAAELNAGPEAYPVTIEVPELGVCQRFDSAPDLAVSALGFGVGEVEPWSAESPRRYDATVTSAGEKVSLRLGFRTVQINGDLFTVNGAQVIFRGMNRHETHPDRGRVFDEEHARADLVMMKQHNVNAIRTSHYPPHPRVLDLADELGLWVIDECDLETHGFVFVGWQGNPSDDPRYESALLDRIERTVERDKNHPSVVLWSLGNEAGTGRNLAAMAQWVHRRDTSRPVHYEGDYGCAYTDVYSRMYPNLTETAHIGGQTGKLLAINAAEGARVRTKPFLMCEYAHAMGNGPGALADYDALIEAHPRNHGGFVWEWRDHGLRTRTADGTEYFGYGGDFGEVVHDGNFVMDGMVLPDDTATPGLADFAAVSVPVVLTLDGADLTVRSRYHSVDTTHLRFVARRHLDGEAEREQVVDVPCVPAGESTTVSLEADLFGAAELGETWLTVAAELAADTPWAEAGHAVATAQWDLTPDTGTRVALFTEIPTGRVGSGRVGTGQVTTGRVGTGLTLGGAEFDPRSGTLTSLHGVAVAGPVLELWRGPTDNDRSNSRGSYELGLPEETAGEGVPGPSSEQRWRARGLDRLVHRVQSVTASETAVATRVRVSAANSARSVEVTYRWHLDPVAPADLMLSVDLTPTPGWDCTWPRVGVRFDLPNTLTQASWFGTGPLESYPDTGSAARVGRFSASVDELNVVYSRPQETGHRAELRTLELSDGTTAHLRDGVNAGVPDATSSHLTVQTVPNLQGHRPGFTLTRYTPQQLDQARHPYELKASEHLHLYLDDAVHGIGSRACGIDVLAQHALWPGSHSFALAFPAPTQ